MRIVMGSPVKGFGLKKPVMEHLKAQGHEIIDVGCYETDRFVTYTSVAERLAGVLQGGQAELGINICGSGTGAAISANKFRGVLACSCESVATARLIRVVNGANCLCMGESVVSPQLGCEMAEAFVNARFRDMEGVPDAVRVFWQEARDEMMARGDVATDRELETL